MPLAGHRHVGIAVEAQLDGPAGLARQHGRSRRDQRRLAFLAAEPAPHAPALHDDLVGGEAQGVSHDVLDFSRMLRRAMHQHAAIFLRQGHRNLPFQVEVVLAADHDRRAQAPRGRSELHVRIAPTHGLAGEDIALGGQGCADVEQRRQGRQLELGASGGDARRAHRACRHGEDGLSGVLHQTFSEYRIIVHGASIIVLARNVGGRRNRRDARCGHDGGEIERRDAAMGDWAHAEAACSAFAGSTISSQYCAWPLTWSGALS